MARCVLAIADAGTPREREVLVVVQDNRGLRAYGESGTYSREASTITRMGRNLTPAQQDEEMQRFADRDFNGYGARWSEFPVGDPLNIRKVNKLIKEWGGSNAPVIAKSKSLRPTLDLKIATQPRDGDNDGRIYDNTPRERPALPKAPKKGNGLFRTARSLIPRKKRAKPQPRQAPPTPPTYLKVPRTTFDFYRDARGNLSPQRQAFHDGIIAGLRRQTENLPRRRHAIFLGGGPASGKSTLARSGKIEPGDRLHLDPDEFKLKIPEYHQLRAMGNRGAAAFVHDESAGLVRRAYEELSETGVDITLDTTGDRGYEVIERRVNTLRKAGYTIDADYVFIDSEEAVRRAIERQTKEGRVVPKSYIEEIYRQIPAVVARAIQEGLFDSLRLWDNRGDTPVEMLSLSRNGLTIHDVNALKALLGVHADEILAFSRGRRKADAAGNIGQLGTAIAALTPTTEPQHGQSVTVDGMAKMIQQIIIDIPFEQAGWPLEAQSTWENLKGECEELKRSGKIIDLAD